MLKGATLRVAPFFYFLRFASMKYLLSLLVFCFNGPSVTAPAQPGYKALIMGRWQSTSDRKYEVVFTKTYKIDYYKGQKADTFFYRIKGDSLIAQDKSDQSFYYYSIERLSKSYLSLTYLDRGNTLVFKRELVSYGSSIK